MSLFLKLVLKSLDFLLFVVQLLITKKKDDSAMKKLFTPITNEAHKTHVVNNILATNKTSIIKHGALIAILAILAMTLLLAVAYPSQFYMLFTGDYSVNMSMAAGLH